MVLGTSILPRSIARSEFLAVFCGLCYLAAAASISAAETHDNQVFLLYEGYVKPIEGRELIPGASDDGGRLVASTMGLVKNDNVTLFVDPGFISDRTLVLEALETVQVHPKDVTHVFISHHHPDHTINAALFPNATVVDFWATYKGDLWEDHADGYEIDQGIKVIRTPGHTNEDASLEVDTSLGTVVFTHVWWNETLFPPVDPLADDQDALKASRALVLATADCIVPGHGTKFVNPDRRDATCSMVRGGRDRGSEDPGADKGSTSSVE